MSNMHASDETKQTKDRQWAHLLATSVGSGAVPIDLGSSVLRLFFKPNEVGTTMTQDE